MRSWIKIAVLAWLVLEVIALMVSVRLLGWPATLILGFATSALGLAIVRRAGRASLSSLRKAMEGVSVATVEAPANGLVRIAAGVLLILPGLVSDLAGLLLLTPFIRESLTRRIAGSVRTEPPGVVTLDPDEWRRHAEADKPAPCEPAPGMLPGGPKTEHMRRPDHE